MKLQTWPAACCRLAVLLSILTTPLLTSYPARAEGEADIILCNSTPLSVSSSIAYRSGGEWRATGWYSIEPGDCIVPDVVSTNTIFYAYAISGEVEWSGPHNFCVDPDSAYHFRNRSDCADTRGFAEHDSTGKVAYTVNYECSDCDYLPTPRYYKNGPPLKVYGKWCGPGYPKGFDPGPPIDVIDTACFEHDQRYVECARKEDRDAQLECELTADSTLMSEFRRITASGEHQLDPARLAYVSTMIRYLSYQAQLKYKAGEARRMMNQGRETLTDIVQKAGDSVSATSASLSRQLRNAWNQVKRGSTGNNALSGPQG